MLALVRLWWKEYRLFGPVWLILLLTAGLFQWLLLTVRSDDVQNGALAVVALCWAVLYAFASGAAAFAGEREVKTLGFLDALPVGRGMLWLGKVSFALISTFGLALFVAVIAAIGTERRDPHDIYSHDRLIRIFGTILFEAVAWSLLWSSLSKNPLLAGVMGVLSVFASAVVVAVPARLLAAGVALAISFRVMTWKPSGRSSSVKRDLGNGLAPVPLRTSSTGRSLAWQVWREGWTTWLLVALIGLVVACPRLVDFDPPGPEVILAVLISLVAGISVFGADNASASRRFLVHHGVRAGTVWGRRLLVWGVVMGSIFGLSTLASWSFGYPPFDRGMVGYVAPAELALLLICGLVNSFAVGLVCGMAITRRITAGMIGIIALIVVLPLQFGLVSQAMIPPWCLALTPLILLAISRAWAGDWLHQREGARPWVRLGGLIVVPFGLLGVSFIAYRAFGVSDVGPQFPPRILQGELIPPEQDAGVDYRRASGLVRAEAGFFSDHNGETSIPVELVIKNGWNPDELQVIGWWKMNQEAIDLTRKASAKPQARFEIDGPQTSDSTRWKAIRGMRLLGQLVALDTRERSSRGDLLGVWDDILVQFRMAHHLGTATPDLMKVDLAGALHHRAVTLAFEWLRDARQTRETIGKALVDLKALPPPPNLVTTIQVESALIEQMLDLSGPELAQLLLPRSGNGNPSGLEMLFFARLVASPWERINARRLCRLLAFHERPIASVEPWRRGPDFTSDDRFLSPGKKGSRLFHLVLPMFRLGIDTLDLELVERRGLELTVALVAWKLDHEGHYPETLEALVPGLLAQVPIDSYSGQPFGYSGPANPGPSFIYSIGPDRTDQHGAVEYEHGAVEYAARAFPGDILFKLP